MLTGVLIVTAVPLAMLEARGAERMFTFAAAGDIGGTTNSMSTLARLSHSNASLFLALGDLSYAGSGSEAAWCNFVTTSVGSQLPFELISGNHEDNGPDGLIDNFAQCLPDRTGGVQGLYGKQYYFDYPQADPLVRFILISPGLTFTIGGSYTYSAGSANFRWVSNAIDGARSSGIPWVVVGMHEPCISSDATTCAIGQDLTDLVIDKRVDLVLQAHSHTYQRSKQLTCALRTIFISECVSNAGSANTYVKGAGTLFVVAGTGGGSLGPIDPNDSENAYFSRTMGSTTPGAGNGFVSYAVHPDNLYIQTSFSGALVDSASIVTVHDAAPTLPAASAGSSFTFASMGRIGRTADAAATLNRLASSGTDFTLAAGDFSYAGTGSEPAWCSFVTSRVGPAYPFELEAGDHEDNGPDGYIGNFTACLPDRIGSLTGVYGKQYYFDYPVASPTARIISISPGLTFTGTGTSSYKVGTSNLAWLIAAIDGARASRIPWVIVAMHMTCLGTGPNPCSAGQDVQDVLTAKRVDLVLQAHDALYQRTKQLSCGIRTVYISQCVVFDGSATQPYRKGAGTVFVSEGVGGKSMDVSNTADPELPYFAETMGKATIGAGFGFVKYAVTSDHITVQTSFANSYSDTFSIVGAPSADFAFSPGSPVVGDSVSFTAGASGGAPPYTFAWEFGDGTNAAGDRVTHTYGAAGTFTVTLVATDVGGSRALLVAKSVSVAAAPLVADFVFSPESPMAGDSVAFTASVAGGVAPNTISWDFGDGLSNSGDSVVHAFGTAGSYTVTLTVVDSGGASTRVVKAVSVSPLPLVADFTFDSASPREGDTVTFVASANGGTGPYAFAWDFGDGNVSSDSSATHVFVAGSYTVTLVVMDSGGQTLTVSKPVTVTPLS